MLISLYIVYNLQGETGAAVSGTSTVQPGTAVPPGAHEGTAVAGTSGPSVGDQGTQAAPEATTTVSIITTTLRICMLLFVYYWCDVVSSSGTLCWPFYFHIEVYRSIVWKGKEGMR